MFNKLMNFGNIDIRLWWIIPSIMTINFVLSFFGSKLSLLYAKSNQIVDNPEANITRKFHKTPIPLLGATGFVIATLLLCTSFWYFNTNLFQNNINLGLDSGNLFWLVISVAILLFSGYFDDKYQLRPKQLLLPIIISLVIAVTLGGLKIEVLAYPFDSLLPNIDIFHRILAFIWLFVCLAATKFLDGLDGLVPTVGIISFLTIASVSMLPNVSQPLIAVFALIWVSGLVGFLPWNFPNARLYLGEGGSEIIGFAIGVLSILSGAKVATTSTVIGWFILDVALVMGMRIWQKRSPFSGDRLHWHFRLQDLGLSKVQVLSLTSLIIIVTAHMGLLFSTDLKIYIILLQTVFLVGILCTTLYLSQQKKIKV
jgi:UDP-GlcNAc:undecaprenyl-phosphate/decaprenyl-phosphate GlcNAc-1-phosphate transferase